jgi:tRNA threonylcarbamoyladenosine biosynthesis protein TsaE
MNRIKLGNLKDSLQAGPFLLVLIYSIDMISKSIEDTRAIALEYAKGLEPSASSDGLVRATVIALRGDLGAGKTTFVKAFASAFGISEGEVTSPTFVIERRLDTRGSAFFKTLIHIDAYRLEHPEEIQRLGWRETLADRGNLILLEWPQNIGSALPSNVPTISFSFIDENTREIVFN